MAQRERNTSDLVFTPHGNAITRQQVSKLSLPWLALAALLLTFTSSLADRIAVIKDVSSELCSSGGERCNAEAALFGYQGEAAWSGQKLKLDFNEPTSVTTVSFDLNTLSLKAVLLTSVIDHGHGIQTTREVICNTDAQVDDRCSLYTVEDGGRAVVSISSPLEDTSSLSVEFVTYDERQDVDVSELFVMGEGQFVELATPRRVARQTGELVLNASFGALYVDEGNVTIECRASSGIITSNVTWTTMNPDNLPASDIITSGMFGEVATYLNLRTPLTLVYQCSVDNATSPVAGVSLDVDNCLMMDYCLVSRNVSNALCDNRLGSRLENCRCFSGYETDNICNDVDECSNGAHNCSSQAACINTNGSFSCQCIAGYRGDGFNCTDIDECTEGTDNCSSQAACINTNGSFSCQCIAGYRGDGFNCTDIDECTEGTDNCSSQAACINTNGSFSCQCIAGYRGDGFNCTDIDECTEGTDNCSSQAACINTNGSFSCQCIAGYRGDGFNCTDIDECTEGTDNCSSQAACINTNGSFSCQCTAGYRGDGFNCTDINECAEGTHNCSVVADCTNIGGGFTCACQSGYTGNGVSCPDILECSRGPHNCAAVGGVCMERPGSFQCNCINGFTGDGVVCEDINECSMGTHNCVANTMCVNTIGSFMCPCVMGFTNSSDGTQCVNVNECLLVSSCPGNMDFCVDSVGSFRCDCLAGFYRDLQGNCVGVSTLFNSFTPPIAPTGVSLTWSVSKFTDPSLRYYRIFVIDMGSNPMDTNVAMAFSEPPEVLYASGANVLSRSAVDAQAMTTNPPSAFVAFDFTPSPQGGTVDVTVGNGVPMMNEALKSGRHYTIFYQASSSPFSRRRRQLSSIAMETSGYHPIQRTTTSSNTGAIVGGVVGGVVILLLLVLLLLLIVYRRSGNYGVRRGGSYRGKNAVPPEDLSYVNPMHDNGQAMEMQGADYYHRLPTKNFDEDTLKRGAIRIADFPEHVRSMKANSDLRLGREYDLLVKRAPALAADASMANRPKNRYGNISAADASRVVLESDDDLDEQGSDYINANFIDGYNYPREYIAAQGPLPNTAVDFWRMIWQCNVRTISMVTNLVEKSKEKCFQYWPMSREMQYGHIQVAILDIVEQTDFVIRTMRMVNTLLGPDAENQARVVKQFHFTAWPDFGAPTSVSPLLNYLRRLRFHQAHDSLPQAPLVIHCSAGVGRTGTLITIDAMIHRAKAEGTVDVFNAVTILRQQRQLMVQTEMQYVFIHDALLEALTLANTEVSASNMQQYVKELAVVTNGQTKYEEEYRSIPVGFSGSLNCTSAFSSANIKKNRKSNIVPYDRTRVKLRQRPGDHGSDYINASFLDSCTSRRAFIATQGPLAHTAGDFWRMIWEHDVGTIVMLADQKESGQETSAQYWPLKDTEPATYDSFLIRLGEEMDLYDNKLRVRELLLTHTEEKQFRKVRHLQYSWTEKNLPPNGSGILDLIGRVQGSQQASGNNPIVVHDSAGVGRTGVFCALITAIERLKLEGTVDVFQTVKILRTQRMALVSTPEEYYFIYRTVLEYLDSFDTYANFK